jgi:hypothetical protein
MQPSAADVERMAAELAPGTSAQRVRELLGDPLVESDLAGGGMTWLYLPADPEQGRDESLSVAFGADGAFARVDRKPID